MRIVISRSVLSAILADARASPEQEICGLLLGSDGNVHARRTAANVANDKASRFEIDPAVLIAAHREARTGGLAVLGHYHSHPGGDPRPSSCDAAMSMPDGSIWLICTSDERHACWVAGTSGLHDRFEPCEAAYID